jgi:RNA polymerase sigma-70 factor, ECF subfamily
MSQASHESRSTAVSRTSLHEERWAALMHAANRGDADAYRRLLAELAPVLRAIVARGFSYGSGFADVEDVVQDILLAIHLKRHTWDERRPLLPWVRAIARNKFVDNLRKRDRHARVPLDDVAERLADTRSFDDTSGIDVSRMLATLRERQRRIVQAISIEGTSASQIAGQLAMTEGAIRVALHRALHSLAKAVRDAT